MITIFLFKKNDCCAVLVDQNDFGLYITYTYINTMKTTYDLNFDLYRSGKQDGCTIHINIVVREAVDLKKLLFDYL